MMDPASFTRCTLTTDQARADDEVYGALADATVDLADAQLRTMLDHDEVRAIVEVIRDLTERLGAKAIEGAFGTQLGPGREVRNHGNAVCGLRNPLASMRRRDLVITEDGHVHREVELGALYEGLPGLVHGGVSAALLDQIVGEAAAYSHGPAVTARLDLHYRMPTPLGPLSLESWAESSEGRKTITRGVLRDADGNTTVEAEALMIRPRWTADLPDWESSFLPAETTDPPEGDEIAVPSSQ